MRVCYSPDDARAATEFDATRKARWVADRLIEDPIPGVELVAPESLTAADSATGSAERCRLVDPHRATIAAAGEPGGPADPVA